MKVAGHLLRWDYRGRGKNTTPQVQETTADLRTLEIIKKIHTALANVDYRKIQVDTRLFRI